MTDIAPRLRGRPRKPRPPWTPDDHAYLVEMAPTGCGGPAIAEALGRSVRDVAEYASKQKISIKRDQSTYRVGGSYAEPAFMPARPYAKPEKVFAGVDFRAPPGRPLPGLSLPTPCRGRVGLPPATAVETEARS